MQLDHLSVVAFGEGSLGCDIGDHEALFALHKVTEHELVQVDVLDEERPQLANVLDLAFVLSLFPRRPEANASLSISHGAVAILVRFGVSADKVSLLAWLRNYITISKVHLWLKLNHLD